MITRHLDPERVTEAAELVRNGGLVVFPTETVYGLGANAFDEAAVQAIYQAKGRPSDNPVIVHVASYEVVEQAAAVVPPAARRLMARFWPGPLTLVLPASPRIARSVTAGLPTVGLRWPAHPLAERFLSLAGVPVAAPSANRSGRPSPTTYDAACQEMEGRVHAILRGPDCGVGLESTVVGLRDGAAVVYRPGAIGLEALEETLGIPVRRPEDSHPVASPGTRHPHYRPACPVLLFEAVGEIVDPRPGDWILTVGPAPAAWPGRTVVLPDLEDYARRLYALFREAEADGCDRLWCWLPPPQGLGLALRDRLRRAAGLD